MTLEFLTLGIISFEKRNTGTPNSSKNIIWVHENKSFNKGQK